MTPLEISNADARRLFLHSHALCGPHEEPHAAQDTLALVRRLGFVQLDSINTVERAHHLILFSRTPHYRREHLASLHHDEAALFEHWTHDASLIPMEFYPHWRHRFQAAKARIEGSPRWQERIGPDGAKVIRNVRARIRREGGLMARDFEDKGKGAWWGWGPSKTALETLWRTGELAIARREGFEKVYDFAERVIPDAIRAARPSRAATTDWACREALARLGFASPQELAAFWKLAPIDRAKAWAVAALKRKELVDVLVEGADGSLRPALAPADIEERLADAPPPPDTMRFLSPFDPAIRDRSRAEKLFGFDYKIEVFVPEAKRRYGYYVLPLIEGDRFIGRADVKAHRGDRRLEVKGFWLEPGLKLTKARERAVLRALGHLGTFTQTPEIDADAALRRAKAG
ncbi:winged helix-turn-helix domain-containing protein [Parvibaculum sp.]|uniref:winged helix-turn-helix domain-containing protein n=1 Tax=Parvibaculum sp. TaxID=2024848 RepID=UPI00272FFDB8|nr:crosslink repair DNA glycosylase YcaQ family protein [Parvibaculum sp.]MDP1625773.1 crosslink repair DNA glycosylase YcaQ family protein [Parvibaculum sp.]MDP2149136.1 crosslink repair DNA glycosylase YcaQ family protein [Parvibaculum sp.]MDP3326871.1 crosslink repair DNA glycosylase YcaQ family protein [Parvibaculum sp.]